MQRSNEVITIRCTAEHPSTQQAFTQPARPTQEVEVVAVEAVEVIVVVSGKIPE